MLKLYPVNHVHETDQLRGVVGGQGLGREGKRGLLSRLISLIYTELDATGVGGVERRIGGLGWGPILGFLSPSFSCTTLCQVKDGRVAQYLGQGVISLIN